MSLDVHLEYVADDGDAQEDWVAYSDNITHNLNEMAEAAGLYKALWRPQEIGIKVAYELIPLLETGLKQLRDAPERFEQFNSSNGWGTYDQLVEFVENYLTACRAYPQANVYVWR